MQFIPAVAGSTSMCCALFCLPGWRGKEACPCAYKYVYNFMVSCAPLSLALANCLQTVAV